MCALYANLYQNVFRGKRYVHTRVVVSISCVYWDGVHFCSFLSALTLSNVDYNLLQQIHFVKLRIKVCLGFFFSIRSTVYFFLFSARNTLWTEHCVTSVVLFVGCERVSTHPFMWCWRSVWGRGVKLWWCPRLKSSPTSLTLDQQMSPCV